MQPGGGEPQGCLVEEHAGCGVEEERLGGAAATAIGEPEDDGRGGTSDRQAVEARSVQGSDLRSWGSS
jgi:hypothetical protein